MPLAIGQRGKIGNDLEAESAVDLNEMLIRSSSHEELQDSSVDSHGTLLVISSKFHPNN